MERSSFRSRSCRLELLVSLFCMQGGGVECFASPPLPLPARAREVAGGQPARVLPRGLALRPGDRPPRGRGAGAGMVERPAMANLAAGTAAPDSSTRRHPRAVLSRVLGQTPPRWRSLLLGATGELA